MPQGSVKTYPATWVGENGEVMFDGKPELWGGLLISHKYEWAMPAPRATRIYQFLGRNLVKTGEEYIYLDESEDPHSGLGIEVNIAEPRAFEEGRGGKWRDRGLSRMFRYQVKYWVFAASCLAIAGLMYLEWDGAKQLEAEHRAIASEERQLKMERERVELESRRQQLREGGQ